MIILPARRTLGEVVNVKPSSNRPHDAEDTRIMGYMPKKAAGMLKEACRSRAGFLPR